MRRSLKRTKRFQSSTPVSALTTRWRSGDDRVVVLDKRGYAPSSRTSDNKTLGCGRPGTRHKTELAGAKWWRRLCSGRGLPYDDEDDEYCGFNCSKHLFFVLSKFDR